MKGDRHPDMPEVPAIAGTLVPPGPADQTLHRAPIDAPDAPTGRGYTVLDTLGQGGVGIVRLAVQEVLGRPVAVKWVRPERQGKAAATRSLLQEGRAAASLEHPNVVPVYDLVDDPTHGPGVVMRRIEGRTWTDYLIDPSAITADFGARDHLDWHLGVLEQVCHALHFAHTRGILHRDLKPDNVMIGAFGEVYVLDWGLAARLEADGPAGVPLLRDDRRLVGTPRFMAPEMVQRDGRLQGVHTDVYLLCGLLYAVLTGQGPHGGHSIEETLTAIPRFRVELPPGTPGRLADLVQRGLDPAPEQRPGSAEAVRLSLQAFREARGAEAVARDAQLQLDELDGMLGRGAADREALYRRFGAARFGFQQALRTDPDQVEARVGLRAALEAMARWELQQGEVRSAEAILAEIDAPPDDLAALRAAVIARQGAEAAKTQAVVADQDARAGQRTRIFVTLVMGTLWAAFPLIGYFTAADGPLAYLAAGHASLLLVVLGLVYWARDSLGRSALNRQVALLLVTVQVSSVVSDAGAWLVDQTALQAYNTSMLIYGTIALLATQALGRGALLAALMYWTGFLFSRVFPEHTMLMSATANATVLVVAMTAWLPAARGELFDRFRW